MYCWNINCQFKNNRDVFPYDCTCELCEARKSNGGFVVYSDHTLSEEEFNRKFYEAVSSTMICPDWDSLANRINQVALEVFEEEMGGE